MSVSSEIMKGNAKSSDNDSIVSIRALLERRLMAFSQKAAILKLLEADTDCDGELSKEELVKNKELMNSLKDSITSTLGHVAVIGALVGTTTFTCVTNPLLPSDIIGPDEINEDLHRAYVICNVIATGFSLTTISLCTFYTLILTTLLTDDEDFVWFVAHVPAVIISFTFCIFGIIFAGAALILCCYALYDIETSTTCLISVVLSLTLYCAIALHVALPVFRRINMHIKKRKRMYGNELIEKNG